MRKWDGRMATGFAQCLLPAKVEAARNPPLQPPSWRITPTLFLVRSGATIPAKRNPVLEGLVGEVALDDRLRRGSNTFPLGNFPESGLNVALGIVLDQHGRKGICGRHCRTQLNAGCETLVEQVRQLSQEDNVFMHTEPVHRPNSDHPLLRCIALLSEEMDAVVDICSCLVGKLDEGFKIQQALRCDQIPGKFIGSNDLVRVVASVPRGTPLIWSSLACCRDRP